MTRPTLISQTLEGEGLRLRAFSPDDAAAVFKAARESIAEVAPYETWCHAAFTPDDAAAYTEYWVGARTRGEAFYFIIEDAEGEFLGVCGISGIEREHGLAGLGFWVRTSATKGGVATRAAARVAQFGFEELGLQRIELLIAVHNVASCWVAEKLGATLEGTLRRRLTLPNGPTDCVLYALLADEGPAAA